MYTALNIFDGLYQGLIFILALAIGILILAIIDYFLFHKHKKTNVKSAAQ